MNKLLEGDSPQSNPDRQEPKLSAAVAAKAASPAEPARHSRLLSKVLSPAVRLWLLSQVERIEDLQVKIEGRDRQLLQGAIPSVSLSAKGAVYQGLHLSQLLLTATGIGINIGQVLKGKPLGLLSPMPVAGELLLREADLNASLSAPLLSIALIEFLCQNLPPASAFGKMAALPITLQNPQIRIDSGQLTLSGILVSATGTELPFVFNTGLSGANRELQFVRPQFQTPPGVPAPQLDDLKLDLGSEVDIQELTLSQSQLVCRGSITVLPG
ncbi:MAG: DUF2993 domain-containing protein [Oscillatoria sp. Prado101]|nr:DUF2993 domain-containing protein [Oscillatoria sp. Prado101]